MQQGYDGQWYDDNGNPIDPSQQQPQFIPGGNQFVNTAPGANSNPAGSGPVVANAGTPWALTQQQLEQMNSAGGIAPGSANAGILAGLNQPPPTSGSGGGAGDWQGLQSSIFGNMPSVSGATPPPFEYDPFNAPAPFSYDAFTAPTGQQALDADPGYQFRLDQGTGALQNSAAARGVLNTGGTLTDLINYGQNAASQEYQNAYGRAANTYDMNRNNAFGNYESNYNNALNSYITNFGNALTKYNTNYNTQYQTPYNQMFAQYQQGVGNQNQLFNQQFATATA